MIAMGIGAMRHKITLQRQTRVADGGGGFGVTWADVDDVFADIKAPSGRERFFGDKIEQNISHVVTIRFRNDISQKYRIKYARTREAETTTTYLAINAILNKDYRERYLELLCTEGAGT